MHLNGYMCARCFHPKRKQPVWILDLFIEGMEMEGDMGPRLLTWFNLNPSMDK